MRVAQMPIGTPESRKRGRQQTLAQLHDSGRYELARRLRRTWARVEASRQARCPRSSGAEGARQQGTGRAQRGREARSAEPEGGGDPDDDGESDPDPASGLAPNCPAPRIDWREAPSDPPPNEHPVVPDVIDLLARAVVQRVQREREEEL